MRKNLPKIDLRLEVALWLLAFILIVVFSRYFLKPQEETTTAGTVRIGYVSWAEGIAMTHLARVILEDKMNYEVNLTMADPAPIFTSIAQGDLDFFLDAWLPITHGTHMDKYGDVLQDLGFNYRDARIGLVVPTYVDIDSIAELRQNAGTFDGAITGIDSGAGIMEATREAMDVYDLGNNMRLLTSSGAAMTASLRDSIVSKEPIVVTGWKPHWMFARWELKFLEDPKNVYGESENIHTVGRPGVSQDLPEVVSFFKNFMLTDQQIGTLMDRMNQNPSKGEAARTWIDNNTELVNSWLPAEAVGKELSE